MRSSSGLLPSSLISVSESAITATPRGRRIGAAVLKSLLEATSIATPMP
ncbi:MAG: hypothetical protein NZ733_04090 [Aigarchaeota archaeon]|nr:hypothetical protein [Aigarchaeota archaeon]MCS7127345.1 hypothetical protein [Candidatus Calditenuaceae archaeon]MDW8042864.1 hypothetical protein [Nitrososphaerota archaeon]